MRYLILLLISFTLFAGDPPVPPPVVPVLKEYNDAIAKAKALYEATCAKAAEKAVAGMEAKNKEIVKKGDLDSAMAVKGLIEKVKSGELKQEAEKTVGLLGEEVLVTKKGIAAELDGKKWNWNNSGIVTFNLNGTMSPNGNWEFNKGKLIVIMGANHTLTPIFEDGKIVSFDGIVSGSNTAFKVLLVQTPAAKP